MSYFRFSTSELNLTSPFATISPQGLITWWNGTAFETYAPGNWSTYDIALTEGPPGIYSGEWPVGLSAGYYDLFLYEYVDGTAANDRYVGGGTEYYGATIMPTLPNYSAAWYAKTPFNPNVSVGTLTIASGANEYLGWDFSNYPQIERGETLSTFVVSCASATITGTTNGSAVGMARFSGAALSAVATVSVTATFSGGDAVVHTGSLSIV